MKRSFLSVSVIIFITFATVMSFSLSARQTLKAPGSLDPRLKVRDRKMPVAKPDLLIANAWVYPDINRISPFNDIIDSSRHLGLASHYHWLCFTVVNIGKGKSGPFSVDKRSRYVFRVPGLAPGAKVTGCLPISPQSVRGKRSWDNRIAILRVDPTNKVKERNETNNTLKVLLRIHKRIDFARLCQGGVIRPPEVGPGGEGAAMCRLPNGVTWYWRKMPLEDGWIRFWYRPKRPIFTKHQLRKPVR